MSRDNLETTGDESDNAVKKIKRLGGREKTVQYLNFET